MNMVEIGDLAQQIVATAGSTQFDQFFLCGREHIGCEIIKTIHIGDNTPHGLAITRVLRGLPRRANTFKTPGKVWV